MLRAAAFYGTGSAAGAAATIFDAITGATITQIPVAGDDRNVVIKGYCGFSDAPGLGSRIEILIGNNEGEYHRFQMDPMLDSDLVTNPFTNPMIEAGDYVVGEQNTISVTLIDPGAAELMSGVIYYEDGEPTIPIPQGRIVTLRVGGTNDGGTTYTTTGATVQTTGRPLSVDSNYFVAGVMVRPEDKIAQVISLQTSNTGLVAVAPSAGIVWFPTCPLKFSGKETPVGKLQVQAATKIEVIWFLIEVPLPDAEGLQSGVTTRPGSTFPGSTGPARNAFAMAPAGGAQAALAVGGGGAGSFFG